MKRIRLGVNIDHVATVRNARGEDYPSPLRAALLAQKNGADSVTIHLREDRRHINENDLKKIRPLLDELFDFEKEIINRTNASPEDFQKSGSYLYLRSGLIERWNTLNEQHTYPDMINPLIIEN